MKIGIITFHYAYNFGSALQAWALCRVLTAMGASPTLIDYRGDDFNQYRLLRTNSARSIASSVVYARKNIERKRSFESFLRDNFLLTGRYGPHDEGRMEGDLADRFDCFICGSDQIWNLDCTGGPTAPYFLSFAGTKRRIAYAPSLAHTEFKDENFTQRDRERISRWLSRFSAVSVREGETAPLFQPLCPLEIRTCLDPTLLLGPGEYGGITARLGGCGKMLFLYMLEKNAALVQYADRLARAKGLEIGYVSRRGMHFSVPSRNYFGVGPSEFLGLVRDSAAVVTNSFHATVFSVLFGTPFQTFATERSGSRMRSLLSELGLVGHLVDGSEMRDPAGVPFEAVESRLDRLRADSLAFLGGALEGGAE